MPHSQLAEFPRFRETVEAHLPGTVSVEDYFRRTSEILGGYGFVDRNTLGVVAVCRDEIASPLVDEVVKHWGLTFGCRSLGGFLLLGRSGIATGVSHAPLSGGRRRFVFYAMPHIAISEQGEIGTVYREGLHEASHACGSLAAVLAELQSGRIDVRMDFDDLEQCCVRQKLLSALRYGDMPDLIGMTRLASRVIHEDIERLLGSIVNPTEFDYAYLTGILVHGPHDTHWIYPEHACVVSADLPGGRKVIAPE
jgi:hypothetical protein